MSVFEDLRNGKSYDIRDENYLREAHGEMRRCRHLCWKINQTDPYDRESIITLERELLGGLPEGTFLTPPFQIDIACCMKLGRNVFANHGLTAMSIGTIIVEDGVMFGPEVGLFTVNHEPHNIRVIMTKEIHIKRNAWIGARVNILPSVTIGENAIIGTGSVVTHDVPDNCVAVGVPAKIVKEV
ncbi:MAG: hypothetical protein IJS28_09280 [Synergistaceae bacterium]|nr:hypothetical protein [Synergistaceae bacterium]